MPSNKLPTKVGIQVPLGYALWLVSGETTWIPTFVVSLERPAWIITPTSALPSGKRNANSGLSLTGIGAQFVIMTDLFFLYLFITCTTKA